MGLLRQGNKLLEEVVDIFGNIQSQVNRVLISHD